MDLKEIQQLIKFVAKSGVSEVKLETKDVKITVKAVADQQEQPTVVTGIPAPSFIPAQPPVAQIQESAPEKTDKEADEDANLLTITSPMIGTFYRKPSPDKPVFVNVGDTVNEGDVVCIVEAMKLFNEIESEVSGKIVKILAEDASPVEFGQPLFLVEPI
ncbi:MAG: acetyl-CoA carboxylase, biotin carboxyl carrier protein [Flavobacteriales bacterium]|nr:MAG: acetyl-CoA carboxylase, biotin carboxyl carrier protein [Flavobacteriales bacterium]